MIPRNLSGRVLEMAQKFPVVSLTGPRQSGKTTLLRAIFPEYRYVSLENPDHLDFALTDPKRFLDTWSSQVIFDEAQRAPKLFNYLQGRVDETRQMGQFILSGSQNFLLMKNISQSLAGRVALLKLFPFSFSELQAAGMLDDSLETVLFSGFYPAIFDRTLKPADFFPNYFETYVQRDIRELQAVQDLTLFRTFVRLAAGRVGQPLNYQSLATDTGISPTTARAWMSILEISHIVFTLPPFYKNFSKRLIKAPKLYFYDTGFACYLLGVTTPEDLVTHHFRGNLFENLLIAELVKQQYESGWTSDLYFWQESNGREIDFLIPKSNGLVIGEIKSAATIHTSFFDNLLYFKKQADMPVLKSFLLYGGIEDQQRSAGEVRGWRNPFGIVDG